MDVRQHAIGRGEINHHINWGEQFPRQTGSVGVVRRSQDCDDMTPLARRVRDQRTGFARAQK
jgi:hypothetical protein